MTRLLDAALAYAERGWPVFPCHPSGTTSEAGEALDKRPLGTLANNGVLDASTNPATIAAWWEAEPNANIGFALGQAGLAVIDLDPGADVADLVSLGLSETGLKSQTPRGGQHWFYALDDGEVVSPSASKLAPHVDVRSFNSYVLLAPSETRDGVYTWASEGKPAHRSDDFVRVANSHREKDPERNTWVIAPDLPENVKAAVRWLETDAKISVEGQGGDNTAYATAAHLRSFGISEDLAVQLMWDHWNKRNKPPWSEDEADHFHLKVVNGYSYATSPPGNITSAFRAYHRKQLFRSSIRPPEVQSDGSQTFEFGRYTIRNRAAINHIPAPSWLLKGLIPEQAYCIMYAPETSFKTFLALDMALSIACGFPQEPANFSDAEILHPGPVLYITGEGLSNIRKRVAGWEKVHNGGREVANFDLFNPAPRLTDDLENLAEFIKGVRPDYKLIVVDTVSRVMQGLNENGQENASAFTGLADWLRTVGENTSVLALHHVNKDGGIRGSGVFAADADVVLRIEDRQTVSSKEYTTELTTIKMKDGPDQTEPLKYTLREIDIDGNSTLVPVAASGDNASERVDSNPRQSAHTNRADARTERNRRAFQDTKRRADYTARRCMIETAALTVLDSVAGKSWAVAGLAIAVAHGLENVSASNVRDHVNDMKTDETSALHARYDPVANRFK